MKKEIIKGRGIDFCFLRKLYRWAEFRDQFNVRNDWEVSLKYYYRQAA
jgi:hypothetical protein